LVTRKVFLIGELAKLFGISGDTLRYYDKIGLLKSEKDPVNNYRYYSLESFFTLGRILFLKSLGISVKDIKAYMADQDTAHLLSLLSQENQDIDEAIIRLSNMKTKIENKINMLKEASVNLDKVVIRTLPEKRGFIISMKDRGNGSALKSAFLEKRSFLSMSSFLIEGQVFTTLSKEDIMGRNYDNFNYFIEILSKKYDNNMEIIEKGEYASITFKGAYHKFPYYYEKILSYIEGEGYEVSGPSIEKNIVDYGFTKKEEEYVSEIQVPIKK